MIILLVKQLYRCTQGIVFQRNMFCTWPDLLFYYFLDDLFSCSYVISMALFALFTWGHNTYSSAPDGQKEQAMKVINNADRFFQVSSGVLLIVVAVFSWNVR